MSRTCVEIICPQCPNEVPPGCTYCSAVCRKLAASERAKAAYAADPERFKANSRVQHQKRRESGKLAARAKAWREAHPDKTRAADIKRRLAQYGLTLEQFEEMFARQEGRCATCPATEVLGVDHDHATGRVRALLCKGCNLALGNARENPDTLRQLAQYIELHAGSIG